MKENHRGSRRRQRDAGRRAEDLNDTHVKGQERRHGKPSGETAGNQRRRGGH